LNNQLSACKGGRDEKRVQLIALLVIVAAIAGVATRAILSRTAKNKRIGYTIVWQTTHYDADGRANTYETETYYMSSTGTWRSVKQRPDGKRKEIFGEPGRGVFAKRGQKLDFLSGYEVQRPIVSEEELRNSPNYLRMETVLGYTAIVTKAANAIDDSTEYFCAPILGGDIIKIVSKEVGGGKTVMEPVALTLGEPDAALLKTPQGMPVDYKHFEEIHGPALK